MSRQDRLRRTRRTWGYLVQLPVRYRVDGERRWYSGVTRRISSSEAVIQSEPRSCRGNLVTMIVSMPSSHGRGACVVGRGSIKKSTPAGPRASRLVVNVTRYRLQRLDRALEAHRLRNEERSLARTA